MVLALSGSCKYINYFFLYHHLFQHDEEGFSKKIKKKNRFSKKVTTFAKILCIRVLL
jgi:hypothetical protein